MSSKFAPTLRWSQEWKVPLNLEKLCNQVKVITEKSAAAASTVDGKKAGDENSKPTEPLVSPELGLSHPVTDMVNPLVSPPADSAVRALLGPTSVNEGPTVATSCPQTYLLNPYKIRKWVVCQKFPEDFNRDDVFINRLIRKQKEKDGEMVDDEDAVKQNDESDAEGAVERVSDSAKPSTVGVKRKEAPEGDGSAAIASHNGSTPAKKLKSEHVVVDSAKEKEKSGTRNGKSPVEEDEEEDEIRIEDSNEGNEVESLQIQEIGAVDNDDEEEEDEDDNNESSTESGYDDNGEEQNFKIEEGDDESISN